MIMKHKNFTVELIVNDIGPHSSLNSINFKSDVCSNKLVLYAVNGAGKSFISRTFRLAEKDTSYAESDDLLTFNKEKGTLVFQIIDNPETKSLQIVIKKGQDPVINNSSELIYHIFNSDFVEENIKARDYMPDGRIDGYILGKAQIDLSSEKTKRQQLLLEKQKISSDIDSNIEQSKKNLKEHGVRENTTEFSLITRDEIKENSLFTEVLSFDGIVKQIEKLSTIPDDIKEQTLDNLYCPANFMRHINDILLQSFPKSASDDELVAFYRDNQEFIESGLDIMDNPDICPYCKQILGNDAKKLIEQYNNFRKEKEASIFGDIQQQIKKVEELINGMKSKNSEISKLIQYVNELKQYFPSLSDVIINSSDTFDMTITSLKEVKKLLQKKSKDISVIDKDAKEIITLAEDNLKAYTEYVRSVIKEINRVNKTKNDTIAERLNLRKNLCKAEFNLCKTKLESSFNNLDNLEKDICALNNTIKLKEQQVKISKKDKVYETLTYFLNNFFNGKYTLDKDSFYIKFMGDKVIENASKTLSDGEKSVVAFCYYMATTHLLISTEDDYNNLFFIIDDPVSSMDFNYVFNVAQSLKSLKDVFHIQYVRLWVFTHNAEFLSILTRNHIIENAYMMNDGKIKIIDGRLLLPYDNHLMDIVKIAEGECAPNYNTPNSIRHVLETICCFEHPGNNIEKFINENDILCADYGINTICQDMSHGAIRKEKPYTDEMLKRACDCVVEYVNSKYKGQILAIKEK